MKMKCVVLLCVSFFLFLSCAYRDNPYDPTSPLHRGPSISVSLSFDSSKVISVSDDLISGVKAPMKMQVSALAIDKADEEKLPITIQHFLDGRIQSEKSIAADSQYSVNFTKSGEHILKFESEAKNGAVTEKEVLVRVRPYTPPYFVTFIVRPDSFFLDATSDTFPLNAYADDRPPARFYSIIKDPDTLVDSIVYLCSALESHSNQLNSQGTKVNIKGKEFDNTLFDSTVYNYPLYVDSTEEEREIIVKAILYDSLGGIYEAETRVIFSKSRDKKWNGQPPFINHIVLVDSLPVIPAETRICFDADVDVGNPDGYIKEYVWTISKHNFSTTKSSDSSQVCFQFEESGLWTVSVYVEDDRGNVVNPIKKEITVSEPDVVKPQFTDFEISSTSGPSPFKTVISVEASDENGKIRQIDYHVKGIDVDVPIHSGSIYQHPFNDTLPYDFVNVGTYELQILARDYSRNSCDTTIIITVTEPQNNP